MTSQKPGWVSRVGRIAIRLVVPISFVFLGVTLVRNFSELPPIDWLWFSPFLLAVACLLQVLTIALSSAGWTVLLRGGGVTMSRLTALRITGVTQIAKYTPGNVLHYVGRASLARDNGVPVEAAVTTITLEAALLAALGATVGIAGLVLDRDTAGDVVSTLTANAIIPALVLVALIAFAALAWAASRRVRLMLRRGLRYVDAKHVALSLGWYTSGILALGSAAWFLQEGLWSEAAGSTWFRLGWASILAWVAGFVTPGAPGGIGVREAVFVAVIGPEIGQGLAVGLAVAQRLASALGDLMLFGLAWVLRGVAPLRIPGGAHSSTK